MCARKSKKDVAVCDCITSVEPKNESVNTFESIVELANVDNKLLTLDDSQDRAQRIILCPQILKVADKVVEAGEQPPNYTLKTNSNVQHSGT